MAETIIHLDMKDKKILFELEKNARQSNRAIGKRVGLHPDLVRYRINKLVASGVIASFLTFVNFAKLGFTDFGLFFNTKKLTKSKETELIAYLRDHPSVSYFARVGGRYDFVAGILARDVSHFHAILTGIMSLYGDYISTRDIAVRILLFHFSKEYLLEKSRGNGELPHFGGEIEKIELDILDTKLLRLISQNARAGVTEISEKLKAPPSTIALRLKTLQKKKIVEGFLTWMDTSKFGFDNYYVLVSFANVSLEIEKRLYNFCKANRYVSWLIKTLGKWDYEIGVDSPNKERFQEVLSGIREHFSGDLTNMEFIVVFQTIKYSLYPF